MSDTISLADLGVDNDPGTSWHPRDDKHEARDDDGNLRDLDDGQVAEHAEKPEAREHPDWFEVLSAEDSATTPDGEV